MPPVAALVVVLTLSAVLLTSGVAKLRDRRATRDAFDALRVPALLPADASATALPWVEVALAGLLLVAPDGWLVPVAVVVHAAGASSVGQSAARAVSESSSWSIPAR